MVHTESDGDDGEDLSHSLRGMMTYVEPVYRESTPKFGELLEHANIAAVSWDHVRQLIEWRVTEHLYELEWKELNYKQTSMDAEMCNEAMAPCNRPKNRYGNIVPYNKTRFRLSTVGDEEGSDYINGNWILAGTPECVQQGCFVATQAPLYRTFGEWYRMIWESGSTIIVMLTGWQESGVTKADPYLPPPGQKMSFGDLIVEFVGQA